VSGAVHVHAPRRLPAAVDPFGLTAIASAAEAGLTAQEALEAELRAEVDRLAGSSGVDIGFRVVTGDALRQLTAVAEDQHADAIVVGASTRIGSRLAGSIAHRLVRQRSWPVTIVP
jgi:nucleotide-binding universal stress UspA family protein